MSRRCTICVHPERDAIDRLLFTGRASNRAIATQHTLSEPAVRRHKSQHLPDIMAIGADHDDSTHLDLGVLVRRLFADARRIQERAEQAGDLRTALAGIRELTRLCELARDTAEVQPEQQRVVRVVWHMGDDELPRSEQPAAASLISSSSAAESVGAAEATRRPVGASSQTMRRAAHSLRPRVKRRRYSG